VDYGNASDWVQAFAAVAALGTSVYINKKSNDFSIERATQKEKQERKAIINKVKLSSRLILSSLKQRKCFLDKIEESRPYTMEEGINDEKMFDMCANSVNLCIEKCNDIDLVEKIFEMSQCLSHIKEDISEKKTVHLTTSDLAIWIDTLENKIEELPDC